MVLRSELRPGLLLPAEHTHQPCKDPFLNDKPVGSCIQLCKDPEVHGRQWAEVWTQGKRQEKGHADGVSAKCFAEAGSYISKPGCAVEHTPRQN